MAPRRKELPEGVLEHLTDKSLVSCTICNTNPALPNWIKRTSLAKHLESDIHMNRLEQQAVKSAQDRQDQERLSTLRHGPPAIPRSTLHRLVQSRRGDMFDGHHATCSGPASPATEAPPVQNDPFEEPVASNSSDPSFFALDLGIDPIFDNSAALKKALEAQLEEDLLEAEYLDEFGELEDEDFNLADEVRAQVASAVQDPAEISKYFDKLAIDSDYFPYPNKLLMMLDIVDNLPRLRMSGNMFRMVLWLLKEIGVPNVPSYDAFRKLQSGLRDSCGTVPTRHESTLGNVFYVNSLEDSIARDFSNPEISKNINLYPEETDGPISEAWQAGRWKEFKASELTPMYARGLDQFYIEEVCALRSGQYVIPHDWVIRKKELTARCSIVEVTPQGWKITEETSIIPATEFKYTYHDILSRRGGEIDWLEGTEAPVMPNPLREVAKGKDLYVVMMPLWCDDVSGNRSKQYNKHINMYMVNGNLPGRLLQQEYFIRYVSASPHATAPEQFSVLKEKIEKTQTTPIECFNASTGREACIILRCPALPADNPQQSEEASHMGGQANLKCRRCLVGGNHEHTESDEGYHSLHLPGLARSAKKTKEELENQLKTACLGIEKHVVDLQKASGTKDKITQHWIEILIQKAREMKSQNHGRTAEDIADELWEWVNKQPGDKYNPLLSLAGLDPTRDTPVEILHTILLGIIKYVWHLINLQWTDAQRAIFASHLQSTDLDGLTVPPIRAEYIIQYRNNLIGKHFKTLMQTMPFHMHDLVTPAEFALVKAVGALGSVLWVHEIENMDEYTKDLEVLIGNVLDTFDDVDPAKIILKVKLHMLTHLPEDIRRFGPAIRNSTEVFECFNGIFRLCSIYSNHQAPSRDIATKFASMDRLKHILSGGYWKKDGNWVHAGQSVLRILQNEAIIQRHLGWVPQSENNPGTVRLSGTAKKSLVEWDTLLVSKVLSSINGVDMSISWRKGISVVSKSGDKCRVGSWIFYSFSGATSIGRIAEIAVPQGPMPIYPDGLLTVEVFLLSNDRHPDFRLPFLYRPADNKQKIQIIQPHDLLFIFSAQHDCRTGKCEATTSRPQLQERQLTTRQEKLIKHNDDNHYLINTYAIHNGTLLRQALPKHLTAPEKIYSDRKSHHSSIAAALRPNQASKRAKTNQKRKETMQANKARKQKRVEAMESEDESLESEEEILDGEDERPAKRRRN